MALKLTVTKPEEIRELLDSYARQSPGMCKVRVHFSVPVGRLAISGSLDFYMREEYVVQGQGLAYYFRPENVKEVITWVGDTHMLPQVIVE